MSVLKWAPNPHVANVPEIADFAEMECFRRNDQNVSVVDISRILQRQAGKREDDGAHQSVIEAFADLQDRKKHCGPAPHAYPFDLNETGTLVAIRRGSMGERGYILYLYLLLATRRNMQAERSAGGYDGTVLFERFCASVATNFLGGPGEASAVVFGTGRLTEDLRDTDQIEESKFASAVNDLCSKLKEGYGFRNRPESKVTARDGKLDVVAWRGFADGRVGRLIAFGQCKTGTHWEGDLTKLNPQGFSNKWLLEAFAVLPVRLYFVADRVLGNWYDRNTDGGIIFDRCRLMQYAEPLEQSLFSEIRAWTKASALSEGLKI